MKTIMMCCLACTRSTVLQQGDEGEEIIYVEGECHDPICVKLDGNYSKHPRFLAVKPAVVTRSRPEEARAEPQDDKKSRRKPRREARRPEVVT